jgi:hypothetical protein
MKYPAALILTFMIFPGLAQQSIPRTRGLSSRQQEAQLLTDNVFHLSEVMLHDVANPPAAARFYAYSLLGAYEAILPFTSSIPNINNRLHASLSITVESSPPEFDRAFCALYTMLDVGRQLMPSGQMLEQHQQALVAYFRKKRKLSVPQLTAQVQYARSIASQVVQYARTDDYNKLSTYARYKPSKQEGHWYPTPPEYMAAVEPEWRTVRTFFLDSAAQCAPTPRAPYSRDTTSTFYHLMKEVYTIGRHLTPGQKVIANFWDCNPFAVAYSGHMAIGLKKISPGGHWMGITGIACKKAGLPIDSAILIHATVAMTLHDAFVSCWHEKYTSNRIRPEGAINKLMDPAWRPLLQTPPFPEYSSGHSVVSAASAQVLTHFLGASFEFTDTSEVYFGLPPRSFPSFEEAAAEAAISRLYGGIHYRDACDQGLIQGKAVAEIALNTLFGGQQP